MKGLYFFDWKLTSSPGVIHRINASPTAAWKFLLLADGKIQNDLMQRNTE
jgi:hypothetical protein